MFPGRQRLSGRPATVDESAAGTLTEPLLQPGDEESPATPSVVEVEQGTSTPLPVLAETPQEEHESAAEESAPDPPEDQNRQVIV
jgi:hypothetical protein